jgi:hypothetical protein
MRDNDMIFSDNQAITVAAYSTNVIDIIGASSNVFGGADSGIASAVKKFILVVSVGSVSFASATPTTTFLRPIFQDSDDGVTYYNVLYDVRGTTLTIASGGLLAGVELIKMPLPINGMDSPIGVPLRRFLRMSYSVGNGPFTAGNINAYLDTY